MWGMKIHFVDISLCSAVDIVKLVLEGPCSPKFLLLAILFVKKTHIGLETVCFGMFMQKRFVIISAK